MPVNSQRAATLVPPHTRAQTLELDWDQRLTDRLAYGLSMLSIPLSGGTEQSWRQLVTDLQAASTDDSAGSSAFQLVHADRSATGGRLDVGVYTEPHEAPRLKTRLNLAVARANGLSAASA